MMEVESYSLFRLAWQDTAASQIHMPRDQLVTLWEPSGNYRSLGKMCIPCCLLYQRGCCTKNLFALVASRLLVTYSLSGH